MTSAALRPADQVIELDRQFMADPHGVYGHLTWRQSTLLHGLIDLPVHLVR
jgi:hypothetical protein